MKLVNGYHYLLRDQFGDVSIYKWTGDDVVRNGPITDDESNLLLECDAATINDNTVIIAEIDLEELKIHPVVEHRLAGEYYIVETRAKIKTRSIFRCIHDHPADYSGLKPTQDVFEAHAKCFDVSDMDSRYLVIRKVHLY